MKFKLPILTISSALIAVTPLVASCSNSSSQYSHFLYKNVNMHLDSSEQLKISEDNHTDYNWYSSNENVATVDEKGLVTTHEVGTTTIMITTKSNAYVDTCTVRVVSGENTFYFGNNKITKSGVVFEKYGNAVTYDRSTNTLTLNNATIKASDIGTSKQLCIFDRVPYFCDFVLAFPSTYISCEYKIKLLGENTIIDDSPIKDVSRKGIIGVGDANQLYVMGGGSLKVQSANQSAAIIYGKNVIIRNCTISNDETSEFEYGIYSGNLEITSSAKFTFKGSAGYSTAGIIGTNEMRIALSGGGIEISDCSIGINGGYVSFADSNIKITKCMEGIATRGGGMYIMRNSQISVEASARGLVANSTEIGISEGAQVDVKVTGYDAKQSGITCGEIKVIGLGCYVAREKQTKLVCHANRGPAIEAVTGASFTNYSDVDLSSDNGAGIYAFSTSRVPLRDYSKIEISSSWVKARGTTDPAERQPGDGSLWGIGFFIFDTNSTKFEDGYEDKYHLVIQDVGSKSPKFYAFLPKDKTAIEFEGALPTNCYLEPISIEPSYIPS